MAHRLVLSAIGVASIRAVESFRKKDRLFEDRFAIGFMSPVWRVVVELLRLPVIGTFILALREMQWPGTMGGLMCRTRYIDDALRDALKEGVNQVVILGAGFDTRAYRIPGIDTVRVFEVDHPAVLAWKKTCLKRMVGMLPPHVVFVPIDFDQQDLSEEMAAAGFRTGVKTFFILEGVTQYITAEAVDATFRYVSRVAVPGSKIVFTYVHRGIIDGSATFENAQKWISVTQRHGVPWIFGIDPAELAQFLSARGFELIEQVGASEYQARYLAPLGRQLPVFEIEKTVLAQIAGM